MRVGGPSKVSGAAVSGTRRSARAVGGNFTLDPEGAASVSSAAAAKPAAGIEALVALQGIDDPLLARKKAVKRGHELLDALDAIKADLLAGAVSEGRLNRIMALVGQARTQADPELDSIVAEIELRARVELAKLGH